MLDYIILYSQESWTQADQQALISYINTLDSDTKQDSFISLARKHGILPIVYKNLQKISKDTTNKQLLTKLQSNYKSIAKKNILMSAELLKIAKLLNQENIPYLAFKGPTLAQLAYDDITMRQFGDLDILVHHDNWQDGCIVLEKNGYKDLLNLKTQQKNVWNKKAKEINLFNEKKSIYIDLQRYIFDDDYPLKFNYNLFGDKWNIEIQKNTISTFSKETLLIYLTIHGSKHLFERIGWIKDIDMLIRNQQIDWVLVDNQLKTIKDFKRMFLLGIYLSYIYYQTPIPKDYIEMFHANKWLSNLETFILSNWQYKKNFIYHTYASLKLFPSISKKVSYISKVALKPSKNEYRLIQFPNGMHFLYYPLRVFSLIKKYLFSF